MTGGPGWSFDGRTVVSVIETTRDHAIGWLPGAVIHVWRGATTEAGVACVRTALEEAVRAPGDRPLVLIGVVEADAPMPDDRGRRLLSDGMREAAEEIAASALVFEGQSFKSAAVRAVMAGLGLLARAPYPLDVFSSVSAATQALTRWCPTHDSEQLARAVETVRAAPRIPED